MPHVVVTEPLLIDLSLFIQSRTTNTFFLLLLILRAHVAMNIHPDPAALYLNHAFQNTIFSLHKYDIEFSFLD